MFALNRLNINNLNSLIKDSMRSKSGRQIVMLLSANMLGIPLAFLTNIVAAKILGVENYGNYSFLNSIYCFGIIIFVCGFFQAANRAIVLCNTQQTVSEYYGGALVFAIIIYLIMSISMFFYGIFDTNLKNKGLNIVFLLTIPSGLLYVIQSYCTVLLPADNRIKELSLMTLISKLLFFLSILPIFFIRNWNTILVLLIFWYIHIIAYGVMYFWLFRQIKVSYKNLQQRLKELWQYNKSFGLHLYFGSIFTSGGTCLVPVLIGYFANSNVGVGLYTLAYQFSLPLSLIPNTIATTHYRQFATEQKLPAKLTWMTIFFSFLAISSIWVLLPLVIKLFYSYEYVSVIYLNKYVSIAMLFYGMADYVNRFLGAHGAGKILRNAAFVVSFALLLTNSLLVPKYGETGASLAILLTSITYLVIMVVYYCKTVNQFEKARKE